MLLMILWNLKYKMNNEQRTETKGATATENTQRVVDIPNYVWCKAEIRAFDT